MMKPKYIGSTVAGIALVLAVQAHAAGWGDIKAWKPLGSRWAVAQDSSGRAIALYDLSYPAWADPVPFTAMGADKINAKQVVKDLLGIESKTGQQDQDVNDVVEKLSDKDTLSESVLPDGWWKNVKWANPKVSDDARPQAFALRELDFMAMAGDTRKMAKALADLQSAWTDLAAENPELEGNILEQIRLVANSADPGYTAYWQPTADRGAPKPKKLADLTSTKWAFLEAAKWEAIEQLADQVTNLVTAPVANAIVGTAFDRYFHFHKLLRRSHENMMVEALTDLQANDPQALYRGADLTSADVDKCIESMSYAQSSLTDAWKWIWKKPVDEWNKEVKKGVDNTALNAAWLSDHQLGVIGLGARFARVDSAGVEQLRLLANGKPSKKNGPSVAYDSANPDAAFRGRLAEEVLTTAIVFGAKFIPIPYVGSGLKTIYKELVEKKIDSQKTWEARLTVHLEQRSAVLGEAWDNEIRVLDHQRVNPLFPSRAKELELIARRKQALGIQ